MLQSKHFIKEQQLLDWANHFKSYNIISIIKDVTNGDWVLFYTEA